MSIPSPNDGPFPRLHVPRMFLGRYGLRKMLTSRGSAAVYSADSLDDVNSERKFVVKISKLDRKYIKNELEIVKRFETREKADVIPTLIEEHVDATTPSLVYSYEGPTLAKIARKSPNGKIERGLLVRLSCHVFRALWRCHQVNVLHCNIQPTNFLLRANGNPKEMQFVLVCGLGSGHFTEDRDGKRVPCERKFTTDALTSWPASQGEEYKERDELMAMCHMMLQLAGFHDFHEPAENRRNMRERLYRDCRMVFEEHGEPIFHEIFHLIFQLQCDEKIRYREIYEHIHANPVYDRSKNLDEIVDKFS